jgi:hypothetical protein
METSPAQEPDTVQRTYAQLKDESSERFKGEIRRIKNDELLADLRYKFGWDPNDPRKSSWQTRDINRELTRRKRRREVMPQWIAIIISTILSIAALVVAILKD